MKANVYLLPSIIHELIESTNRGLAATAQMVVLMGKHQKKGFRAGDV